MDRIKATKLSLTVFACGIIGLLPVIGIIPAVYALFCCGRVSARYQNGWNPASDYLAAGACFALLGLLGTVLVTVATVISCCD